MRTNQGNFDMRKPHDVTKPTADWATISVEFHRPNVSIRAIARAHGISEAAIRKHAKRYRWRRPGVPHDPGVEHLAKALADSLGSIDGVFERSRLFVCAMVALRVDRSGIAAALAISEQALIGDFAKELSGS
jgi:hypothetical protein